MAITERAESYLWSNIDLQDAAVLVWEYEDQGLAMRIREHVASIGSHTSVMAFAGRKRDRGASDRAGRRPSEPIADFAQLEHGSIDCAVLALSAHDLTFTQLLALIHKVHLLLRTGGRLIVRIDSLRGGQSPDLRWWNRRNRLAKAVASLAGQAHGAELTLDELVSILQVVGFHSIQPMLFHGEPLSPIALTRLVEEITGYYAQMDSPNWRQAISEELKLLRHQIETEKGYTGQVAIIDATKQAKQ